MCFLPNKDDVSCVTDVMMVLSNMALENGLAAGWIEQVNKVLTHERAH